MANRKFRVGTFNPYNLPGPKPHSTVEYVSVLNDHLVDDTLTEHKVPVWQSGHGQVTATIRLRR